MTTRVIEARHVTGDFQKENEMSMKNRKKAGLLKGDSIRMRPRVISLTLVFGGLLLVVAGSYVNRVSGKTDRVSMPSPQTTADSGLWQLIDEASIGNTAKRRVIPSAYKTLVLDKQLLG